MRKSLVTNMTIPKFNLVTNNMTIENENSNIDMIYRQLLGRPIFSGEILEDKITKISRVNAQKRLDEMSEALGLSPQSVIDSSLTKLSTWNIGGGQLDHTPLLGI